MPTYQYKCKKCAHKFDKFQKMSDKPVKICPKCKGPVMRLISTGAGLIFKGSGFYQTDYKTKKVDNKTKEKVPPCNENKSCDSCKKDS